MTTLLLVRHAVHGFVDKVLVGRRPGVPLSPDGVAQARRLRDRLARVPVSGILSSPIERAAETAAILAEPHGLAVSTVPELAEIDCGDWTGKSFADLADDPRWQLWNSERGRAGIPGGETMAAVQHRAGLLVDRLAGQESAGPLVLVSHADVIKAVVAGLLGMPLDHHGRIVIDPASVTTVDLWGPGGGGRVQRLNETAEP